MRSLDLSACCVRIPSTPTCGSDVYMYGALVHEIIAEAPLFGTLGPHELIYAVACGRKHPTANLQTSTIIKVIDIKVTSTIIKVKKGRVGILPSHQLL